MRRLCCMKKIVKNLFLVISSFVTGGLMIFNFIYYIKSYAPEGFSSNELADLFFLGCFAFMGLVIIIFIPYYMVENLYYFIRQRRTSKRKTIDKILERQTMKPKYKQRIEDSDGEMYTEDLSFCPNCDRVILYKNSQGIHYGDKVAECPNCGTKLKWED